MGKEEEEEAEEQVQEKAQRLKALAEAKYKESNLKTALKYAKRAHRLCPDVDSISSMVTAFKILRTASKSPTAPDWYKLLQAEPFCHFNTIKKQYKKLALVLHPDKNPHVGSEEAFKLVNEGFRFLSDKIRRKEYDMKLRIRIQNEKMESEESVWGETFWTACSTCRLLHQFERKYLGHNLVCPSCRKSFQAVEVGSDDGGVEEGDETIRVMSERLKMRNSGGGGGGRTRGSVSKPRTGSVELRRRVVGGEMGIGRAKAVELKRKGENGCGDLEKEVDGSGGEWSGGRLRSGGLWKRMSSVGEIMDRSQLKRVKTDDETMTLAELQSQVKRKSEKEKTRAKSKERKEREREREREQDKVRHEVSRGKRDLKVEKRLVLKKIGDAESVNGETLKKSLGLALAKKKGSRDSDLDVMAVEDSDFYDFDKDRVERSFKQGPVWAIYDDDDGMPRHYALIDEVVSVNPFEVKISWLDIQSNSDEMPHDWERTVSHASCGRFKVSRKTSVNSVNIFSHVVDCERAAREVYRIYPKKGSVWALYKESTCDGEGRDLSVKGKQRCYEIVVCLTTYSEMHGLSMAYLEKVDGFKTIFKRREIGSQAIRWLEKDQFGMFSHQIPARKLSGDENPELSKDCWELDPASLPADLLSVGHAS